MANLKANTSMQYANARKTNADARKAEVDAHNAEETGSGGGGIFSNIRDLFGMAERAADSATKLNQLDKQKTKPRGQKVIPERGGIEKPNQFNIKDVPMYPDYNY